MPENKVELNYDEEVYSDTDKTKVAQIYAPWLYHPHLTHLMGICAY
jgi:hypothetical protein